MELIRGLHNIRPQHQGCALSIGNYDGVHLGHQALLGRLKQRAQEHQVPVTVMVFEPTPREFFKPARAPGRVASFRGKLAALTAADVDRILVVRFDRVFAQLAAVDFVNQVLVEKLGVKAVVVGDDFRYGVRRSGDLAMLQLLGRAEGFTAEAVDSVMVDGERVSSSAVRAALGAPDLVTAEKLLGRPYSLTGRVRRGLSLGRKLDMRTANITIRRPSAICFGVFAVDALVGSRQWQGVASIGVRPTLANQRVRLLETHLFDETQEMYGETMEVRFRKFLRHEQRFDSLKDLQAQMHADAKQARDWFASTTL